jgi:hypothetical protein
MRAILSRSRVRPVSESTALRVERVAHERKVAGRQLAHSSRVLGTRIFDEPHQEQRSCVVIEAIASS